MRKCGCNLTASASIFLFLFCLILEKNMGNACSLTDVVGLARNHLIGPNIKSKPKKYHSGHGCPAVSACAVQIKRPFQRRIPSFGDLRCNVNVYRTKWTVFQLSRPVALPYRCERPSSAVVTPRLARAQTCTCVRLRWRQLARMSLLCVTGVYLWVAVWCKHVKPAQLWACW